DGIRDGHVTGVQTCALPISIQAHWSVMMAQSLNAIANGAPNPAPGFTTTQVSEVSNHYGAICTMGIGCSTGGDRGLLDFLSVTRSEERRVGKECRDRLEGDA